MTIEEANIRDRIIFGTDYDEKLYVGGIQHFTGLRSRDLCELMGKGLIDVDAHHNDAPSAWEFLRFASNHPCGWFLNGFAESVTRTNPDVSITGIESTDGDYTREDLIDFINLFRGADELDISENGLYCWYD